ncbi:MAG: hypothetical protein GYA57_06930 [Myxococcales bacterium]|nr:hypothetical protein [Myxococcales bacterium]
MDEPRRLLRTGTILALLAVAGCASTSAPADGAVDRGTADDAGDVPAPDGEETEGSDGGFDVEADGGSACTTSAECNDGIACTDDRCEGGRCVHEPRESTCEDGNACTRGERCDPAFGCLPGSPIDCTDGIDCTRDECSPLTGECLHAPDHRRCVEPEFCYPAAGGCAPAPPCATDPDCDDGDPCNGVETCGSDRACARGTPIDCDDGVECTRDRCDPATGTCSHTPLDSRCNDGDVCNGAEICDPVWGCEPGTAVDCDDGVACTDDRCDSGTGACSHVPIDARCSDLVFCNGLETCDAAAGCRPGTPPSCDDGVPCTEDRCDGPTDRCLSTPRHDRCDDGQSCNGQETCSATVGCRPGIPRACDDGLACTTDRCDPAAAGGAGDCVSTPPDLDGDTHADARCLGDDCDDAAPGVHPGATEACNAVDDDCDTEIDERFSCVRGQVRTCTASGGCTGAETCGDACTWGSCTVLATEVCNGVDDTCNGLADETFPCVLGATRACTLGACAGTQRCVAGCLWGACEVSIPEACNAVDDDCDTATDEDFTCVPGRTQACRVGACSGSQTCGASCAWGECTPPAEICNGLDDDCDGATDEIFDCRAGQTRACANACGAAGIETCRADGCTWDACCAAAEDCANTCDDDCDGVVNDGCCVTGDTCACPAAVRAGGGRHTGSTVGLTNDFGSASCVSGTASPDVVYRLDLAASTFVILDTNGSSFDTALQVYRGGTCPGTALYCDNDSGLGNAALLYNTFAAGTYYIVVDGYGASSQGNYVLNVALGSGDTCTSPRQTGGPGIYSGSTCGYHHEYASSGCGGTGEDIVYRLDLAEPHTVVFDLCGSSLDSVLYVRSGTCASGTQLGCNDDAAVCGSDASFLRLPLAAGTYHVFIDGYSGSCGLYSMEIRYE